MKNLFIKALSLVCLTIGIQAQQFYTTNNLAASNHVVFVQGKVLQQITLYSTNANPTIVRLRDWPYVGAVSTNAAYTNFTYTTAQQVQTIVGSAGLTNLYTNTVVSYTANNVAASTNTAVVPRYTLVVPASPNVLTYDFSPDPAFVNGLTLSNDAAGLNMVLQYRNP